MMVALVNMACTRLWSNEVNSMPKKYKARKGSHLTDKQAQRYGAELHTIIKKHKGELTPIKIVEAAREPGSPLNDFFEWNDQTAGHKYRLQQARELVGNIVEVIVINSTETEQRSFFNVTNTEHQKVYVTLETAISSERYRKELLDKIIRHLDNTVVLMKMFRDYQD